MNDLGPATGLELAVLVQALQRACLGQRLSRIIGPARMMTALDVCGFSLTLYPAMTGDLASLRAGRAVRGPRHLCALATFPLLTGLQPIDPVPSPRSHAALVERACKALVLCKADPSALDARSGDGDTGSTPATAAKALLPRTDTLPQAELTQLFRAIALDLCQTLGGSLWRKFKRVVAPSLEIGQ